MTRSWFRRHRSFGKTCVLTVLVVLTYYPLFFMLQTSFKSNSQFYANFWAPTWPFHMGNYSQAWSSIAPYMLNSVIVTGLSTLGVVAVSCLAAYAFSRIDFPGRQALYYAVIALNGAVGSYHRSVVRPDKKHVAHGHALGANLALHSGGSGPGNLCHASIIRWT